VQHEKCVKIEKSNQSFNGLNIEVLEVFFFFGLIMWLVFGVSVLAIGFLVFEA